MAFARHPQARAPLARLDADRGRGAIERRDGLEVGLDGDGDRDACGGNLRRRAEEDLGLARTTASCAASRHPPRASLWHRCRSGGRLSPPPESLTWTFLSWASSPVTSRKGTPAVLPSTRQGPISFWPSIETFSAKELIRAARARRLRRDEELADAKALRWPIRGPPRCQDDRSAGRRQLPCRRDGDADVGPADPRLRETDVALKKRHQGQLGPDDDRPSESANPAVFPPRRSRSRRILGRRQKPDADAPSVLSLGAGGARNQPVDRSRWASQSIRGGAATATARIRITMDAMIVRMSRKRRPFLRYGTGSLSYGGRGTGAPGGLTSTVKAQRSCPDS